MTRGGCCNDEIRQGDRLLVSEFAKPCDVARGFDIHAKHTIREVRQYRRHQARDLIGPIGFSLAPQLQDAAVHLGDGHDRQVQTGAVPLQPRDQVRRVHVSLRIEHRDDVGVE